MKSACIRINNKAGMAIRSNRVPLHMMECRNEQTTSVRNTDWKSEHPIIMYKHRKQSTGAVISCRIRK